MGIFSRKKKAQAIDPVCGMTADPLSAADKAHYLGTAYYFCSQGCKNKFVMAPAKYAK